MKNLTKKNLFKNKLQNKSVFAVVFVCALMLFSCYSPNPIYGKWADNNGNQITFNNDLTFSATIYDSNNTKQMYDGTYNVIENVMVFAMSDGRAINTEWDIRGSILYLTWTDGNSTEKLSLYHIAK